MGNTGAQMGGWFRKPIGSLADFKGTKFRVGGFGGKVVERIGGVPQNIPAARSTRRWKRARSTPPSGSARTTTEAGLYKVAPNYAYPGWWEGGPQLDLHVNAKAYDALSPEYKAVIECASAYCHRHAGQVRRQERRALKQLVAGGAKLFPFPKDLMDAAFKESMALYSEISAKNPNWKKVYDDYSPSAATATCGSASPKPPSTTSCSARSCDLRLPARPAATPCQKGPASAGPFFLARDGGRAPGKRRAGGRLLGAAASCLTASEQGLHRIVFLRAAFGLVGSEAGPAGLALALAPDRPWSARDGGASGPLAPGTPMVSSALSASICTPWSMPPVTILGTR
jgi:hypothetical protein